MSTIVRVLDRHLEHYPLLQAVDVYKLLYQGVYGPGHLLGHAHGRQSAAHSPERAQAEEQARKAIENEIAGPGSSSGIECPATEPLDPEGRLVRVNLWPLRSDPGAPDRLARALLETAHTVKPDPELLRARLAEAVQWCAENLSDQCGRLSELAAQQHFPAMHHSAVYVAAYRPAYRVVLKELWERTKAEVR